MRMSGGPEARDLYERMRYLYENGHSVTVEPDLTVHYHHYSPENYTYRHDHRHIHPHRHPVVDLLCAAASSDSTLLWCGEAVSYDLVEFLQRILCRGIDGQGDR